MKPKSAPAQEPDGLFKTPFETFIDKNQPLVVLANKIDWQFLEGLIRDRFKRPLHNSSFAF